MKKYQIVLLCLYVPLAIVSFFFVSWWVFYEVNLKDAVTAVKTNFVNNATYAEDDVYFMEINIYDNVVEWKWNYYVDTSLPEKNEDGTYDTKYMFSTGVQFYSQDVNENFEAYADNGVILTDIYVKMGAKNCTYYSNDGSETAYVSGGTNIANQNKWIWDVGGELCLIEAKGDVKFAGALWISGYEVFDTTKLMFENWESALTCENGLSIRTFDFSRYYTLKTFNSETGKFDVPVTDEKILKEWTFVNVKVTKSSNKMISASQSLFNSYKGDSDWQADGTEDKQTYWMDETVYHLDNNDLTYTKTDDGYYLSLKSACEKYLSEFKNVYFVLDVNLDEFEEILNIKGLAENAFGDVEINEINISSSEKRDFIVYDEDLNIKTTNVTIISPQNLITGGEVC